jgi:predicted RNA binding protein YcfA (HicA-like mRNA interferase family)
MGKAKPVSGDECIRILVKEFGFVAVRQRGSHVVLRNASRVTVVPRHRELDIGTLKGILKLAQVDEHEFFERRK